MVGTAKLLVERGANIDIKNKVNRVFFVFLEYYQSLLLSFVIIIVCRHSLLLLFVAFVMCRC